MSRNLIIACAFLGGAFLALISATAPDCEGRFCFNLRAKTETGRKATAVSAVPGTGRETSGGGTREPAPAASGTWLTNGDAPSADDEGTPPGESGAAAEASEARQGQGNNTERGDSSDASADGTIEGFGEPELTPAQRRARQAAEEKAAKRWNSLVEAALNEPDDELRGEAINGVALQRSAESVAVLNEVAALDPSPDNRLQAVQQLWYSAADGLDSDGSIMGTLRAALDDPDEAIAEMAEKALADLKALEESRALE